MLPRADLNTTRPPASVEAPTHAVSATDSRLELFRRLTQIDIGKELQATVDAALDDGTYLVKIADANARMALPVGTRVGDKLSMVFIAHEPRPTFLLTQQGSATASISTTARLIDHLLKAAEQEGMPAVVVGRAPLIGAPADMNPKTVAASLFSTLTRSGLFYESHLHEWISGSRSRADLAREPQADLAQTRSHSQPAGTPEQQSGHVDVSRIAANLRELGAGTQALLDLMREAQSPSGSQAATDVIVLSAPQEELPPLDRESSRMVNLQLNALEHHQVRWQGELWPGRPMEWEVSEDKPDEGSNDPQQAAWTSTVRFELPHLGDISATVRLLGSRVHVQINTATDEAAASLHRHSGSLADALDAAGAPLDVFTVKRDESP